MSAGPVRCERQQAPTHRIVNWGAGPKARCRYCGELVPAEQVPWGKERRDSLGRITASFAIVPHPNRERVS